MEQSVREALFETRDVVDGLRTFLEAVGRTSSAGDQTELKVIEKRLRHVSDEIISVTLRQNTSAVVYCDFRREASDTKSIFCSRAPGSATRKITTVPSPALCGVYPSGDICFLGENPNAG